MSKLISHGTTLISTENLTTVTPDSYERYVDDTCTDTETVYIVRTAYNAVTYNQDSREVEPLEFWHECKDASDQSDLMKAILNNQ